MKVRRKYNLLIVLLIILALSQFAPRIIYSINSKLFYLNSKPKFVASNIKVSSTEQSDDIITVENDGNPIQLVINAGSLNSPTYVKLGQITEVKNTEVRLFIYLKNKDLLSYIDSRNLNLPQMVIIAKPSNCQIMTKNPLTDPNSFNCAIDTQASPDKSVDISIEKIYDKSAKQILVKPITFKLKINENK